MKKLNLLICITIVFAFSIVHNSNANWHKSDQNLNSKQTQVTQKTQTPNSDSLPKGVTQDWLNDLRDESGKRISHQEDSRLPGEITEDPETDALQRKVFNGLSAGSNFGFSVSSAGDVNGDGFDDVIVGAYGYSSFTGRAYIYFGGVNMNTVADVTLTGVSASNFFGYSVSKAGDVNGDGYSDVVVGAYGYSSSTGRAYIYFGGLTMNNTVDVTLTGESTGNLFGISVSSSGDVNSDGYSDVLVGASGYSSSTGRAYIYFGGSSMNNTADVIVTGEAANNVFGCSVASAGDVNADGFSDIFIGAYGYNSNNGRSYIYLGGNSMDNITDVVMTGESANNYFGGSVCSAGDVNGDGYSDVVAGAYGRNSFTGKTYIYFGGASMNSTADVTLSGEAVVNYFGASVSSAGDINGDGFSDIIIGAYGNNSNSGKSYVYFGGSIMDTVADVTMTGEGINNNFGYSVGLAGDLNQDGYSDLLIGAYGYGSNTGRAYYFTNTMSGEDLIDLTITGESANSNLGTSISSAGDVNGDGYSDFIIGASGYSSSKGRVYIFYGGISIDNIADVIFTGQTVGSKFGISVSGAGDVNGDGYSDVVIGASGFNTNTGKAYIYYGGSSMDTIPDVTINGSALNDNFGISVSGAGDINGDGYSDVLIGADGAFMNYGEIKLFYGSTSMDNIPDYSNGGSTNSKLGHSVSAAGDLNGDGYSDFIAGAYGYNSSTGIAYIFYGGAVFPGNVNLTLSGENTNNNFGYSVSSAGDVNGDGYSDIIIGAYQYNVSQGKAYIYYGGIIMDNSADVILYSEFSNNYFGYSVSNAGDVNNDGYSDVIVGAPLYNGNGISNAVGKSYIYFGSSSMNNIADIGMTGQTVTDYNGTSVSAAGDLNGDGYCDVISGASGNNSGTGKAYIYFSSPPSVKPILNYVKDVPNDQGGKVNLKWARSGYDVQGNSIITDYLVQRSFPPSGGNFSWQNVMTIPASHESFYTYVDLTPSDSTTNGSSTFYYRITARTNDINQSWRSNILSGRSLDNISPPVVSPFNAFSESVNVRLTWKRNSAPDLLNYVLFRSVSPSIDPYSETPLSSLSDSTYLDTAPLSGLYYYFIVAQDIHNNYSPVAVAQSPATLKNLFTFGAIQGLYDAVLNTMIYDTVTVYLRNAVSPFAKVDSSKKELYGPGTGQEFSFSNAQNGTPYYIEVKHRNALETWSADPVTFVSDAASIAFSVDAIYAYGSNQIPVDNSPYNVFAFYSGDVNQDGYIDLTDVLAIYNGANNFLTGYVVTDLTGDSIVDLTDILMAYNNSVKFVSVIRP